MQQDTAILSQEYILSDLEFTLSKDLESSQVENGLIMLKHVPTKKYLLVTSEQLFLLKRFRQPQSLAKLIPILIADRKCPALREIYELVLQSLKNGILTSEKIEPAQARAIAAEWNWKLHFKMANLFAIVSIVFGLSSLFFTEIIPPTAASSENLLFAYGSLLIGYLSVCGAMSLGYFLSACLLRGFGHEVYNVGINWRHLFPHFFVDISDACMSGRNREVSNALVQLAPIFLVCGIMAYFRPEVVFIPLLGLFQATQPHRNSSGWLLLESLFKKKVLAIHSPPIFSENLDWMDDFKRKWKLLDKPFLLVSSIYTIVWAITFGFVITKILQIPIIEYFQSYIAQGYHRNFIIFIGTVLLLFSVYVLTELIKRRSKPTTPLRKKKMDLKVGSPKDPSLTHEQLVEFLQDCLLFQDLDEEELSEVANRLDIRFFKKKRFIYREGEAGAELHIVASGRVEMMMNLKSGRPVRVTELGAGEIFGEKSVIFDVPHARSIRSVTPTACLVLSTEDFKKLLLDRLGFKRLRTIIEKHYFMYRTPLCQEWTNETMSRFAKIATFSRYQPGEKILTVGLSNKFFYIVYDGILEVQRNRQRLARLESGEFFGEISLLQNSVCVADVVAVTECRCLIVSRVDFLNMIGQDYRFGLQFERIGSRRLKHPIFPLKKGINYSDAAMK